MVFIEHLQGKIHEKRGKLQYLKRGFLSSQCCIQYPSVVLLTQLNTDKRKVPLTMPCIGPRGKRETGENPVRSRHCNVKPTASIVTEPWFGKMADGDEAKPGNLPLCLGT